MDEKYWLKKDHLMCRQSTPCIEKVENHMLSELKSTIQLPTLLYGKNI